MSAALSLAGLMVFAATGLTLNNAAWIESAPEIHAAQSSVPDDVLSLLARPADAPSQAPLPEQAEQWLNRALDLRIDGRFAEYSADEVYVSLPEPGADAWLVIDLAGGQVEYERSWRGWVAYFNDLHKGRYTGAAWSWFIDILAIACLIFAITGLFLMKMLAAKRKATWPLTGLGVLVPLLLMLLWMH